MIEYVAVGLAALIPLFRNNSYALILMLLSSSLISLSTISAESMLSVACYAASFLLLLYASRKSSLNAECRCGMKIFLITLASVAIPSFVAYKLGVADLGLLMMACVSISILILQNDLMRMSIGIVLLESSGHLISGIPNRWILDATFVLVAASLAWICIRSYRVFGTLSSRGVRANV